MMRLRFLFMLLVSLGVVGVVFFAKNSQHTQTSAQDTPLTVKVVATPSPSPTMEQTDMEDDSHVSTGGASISVKTKQVIDDKYLGEFAPSNAQKKQMAFGPNEAGLEQALQGKYGNKMKFLLTISDGQYAQGLLDKGTSQDKWWLAVQKSSKWMIIADGYSYVTCEDISSYAFPPSIVPMCWSNTKNTLIQR